MLTIAQALQCLAYMGTEEMNTWSILLFPYFRRKEKFIPDSNTILCFIQAAAKEGGKGKWCRQTRENSYYSGSVTDTGNL